MTELKSKVKVQKSKVTKASVKKAVVVKTPAKKAVVKKEVKILPKETPARKASASVAGGGLKISVYDTNGKVSESLSLPKEIFGVEVNNNLMTQAVRVYLANQRRGTVKTKTRGEVSISTRKIYKQKGTGRARHGAASAPIFVGGGVAFGPRQRDYSLKFSQKMKRVALFSALTTKLKDGQIKIVSGLEKIEPKTKTMNLSLLSLDLGKKNIILVTPGSGKNFEQVVRAARNIEGITVMPSNLLNTYEVLRARNLLFMKDSINSVKETFLKEN